MSELEALQKEIERLDQRIAEIIKSGSSKDKDEIIDGLMKRIQALEDNIASIETKPKVEKKPKKKEKPELKAEPKDPRQIDFTEEEDPWWWMKV